MFNIFALQVQTHEAPDYKLLMRNLRHSLREVSELGMGRYRYQILDTIDTGVLKKSIDTGKKYRCFDISAPAIFFILVSGIIMKINTN